MRKLSIIVLVLLGIAVYGWSNRGPQADAPALPGTTATAPAIASPDATAPPPPASNTQAWPKADEAPRAPAAGAASFLPAEAIDTLRLIANDGPYPHRQDGSTFGNREGHLPKKARGYYREFTVETPRLSHRGARRIITGGRPPQVCYYTDDHYDSFREFDCATGSR